MSRQHIDDLSLRSIHPAPPQSQVNASKYLLEEEWNSPVRSHTGDHVMQRCRGAYVHLLVPSKPPKHVIIYVYATAWTSPCKLMKQQRL